MQINYDFVTNNGSYVDWDGPRYICLHYTGGAGRSRGETAKANAQYYQRDGGRIQCGCHFFVGDDGIFASTPEGRGAWTQGNYTANKQCVSIEVVAGDDEAYSDAEVALLRELVPHLMAKYGIPRERVIRHYDVADVFPGRTVDPHKLCPRAYVSNGAWQGLLDRILGDDDEVTDADIQKIVHGVWEYMWKGDDHFPPMPYGMVHNPYNMLRMMPELVAEYAWPEDTTVMDPDLTANQYDKPRQILRDVRSMADRLDAIEDKLDGLIEAVADMG